MLKKNHPTIVCFLLLLGAILHPLPAASADPGSQAGESTSADAPTPPKTVLAPMVVTAEKQESTVQEIAGSVSVVSDEQIRDYGVENIQDIFYMTPNLYITKTGDPMSTFASMRGISSSMISIPTVGVYIDGVYSSWLDVSLLDIERVEILRGPQGTLYGRNTEAGIINIITKKPTSELMAELSAEAGSYNTYSAKGYVNGPIVEDVLCFNAALRYRTTEGPFENQHANFDDSNLLDSLDGRMVFRYTPNKDLDVSLSMDYQQSDGGHTAYFAPLDEGNKHENINVDDQGGIDKEGKGATLRAEYKFSGLKLVSITAGRNEYMNSLVDVDFTPYDLTTLAIDRDLYGFSQELRLVSDRKDSPLQWVGGLFILSEYDDRKYDSWMNFYNMGMGMPGETLTQESDTYTFGLAGFGQATYTFNDLLSVTLGLRYDREQKDFDYQQTGGDVLSMMGYGPMSGSASETFEAWSPKAAISLKATENLRPYFSVSRGFRSGGFNDMEELGSTYDPEFTWNYELGLKTTWLGNRLTANLALFYIDWSDMQVEVLTTGGTSVAIDNAGKATSQGIEFELTAHPVRGLQLMLGAAYTDAVYDDYQQGDVSYDGNKAIDSPEYTLNLGGTYRFDNGFFVNARYNHYGNIYFDPANTHRQDHYGLANAKIGYEAGHFDAYLFCNNILDEEYVTRAFEVSEAWYGRAGNPRTFGLMLNYRF